eukprot:COSAG05_NODE_2892_length_2535_cov_2.408867_3_plen_62_part_00
MCARTPDERIIAAAARAYVGLGGVEVNLEGVGDDEWGAEHQEQVPSRSIQLPCMTVICLHI